MYSVVPCISVYKLLNIGIEEFKENRSDRANRYFHKLCSMIAKVQGLSLIEVKNQMISDYGYRDENMQDIIIKDSIDWRKIEKIHLQPTTATRIMDNGILYRVYYVMMMSTNPVTVNSLSWFGIMFTSTCRIPTLTACR